jgi:predicted double-glycine peptidase
MDKYRRIPKAAIKIPLPDTIQQNDFSCGASALQAVCAYYGVGPEEEWEYVRDLKMDVRVGSHPFQIKRAAKRYGLRVIEHQPMTIAQLKRYLDRGKPVLMMIQAWSDDVRKRSSPKYYKNRWIDGHWVVAVGYDSTGLFFEDPSLEAVRGYLSYADLEDRWHDTGPRRLPLSKYGMVVWKPGAKKPAYATRARYLE